MNDKNTISRSALRRRYGSFTTTALVVANMVGAGIFTTSGVIAGQLPHVWWVILCWLLGGVVAISGALCYAELATRMPREGGEYYYLKELYHPSLGFLTGWTSFLVGFSAPIALSALGFTEYLYTGISRYLPDLVGSHPILFKKAFAVFLIILFTGLHYLGGRIGPRIQNILTSLKILLLLGLAGAGLLLGKGSWENFSVAANKPFDLMAFGSAMMMVMFSYSGWNASAYIAGEVKNPRRTLPVSLVSGTLIVILLYIAINIFYFYAAPFSQLEGSITVAEVAVGNVFGKNITELLGAMIGIVLLSSLSAFIMIGPRVYYAMATDGLFFKFAARIHPRFGVPDHAIIVQGMLAVLMVVAGTFEQLLMYVGFALGIFPWLAVVGLFKARRLNIGKDSAVKVWGYPWVPLFFLASSLSLMVFAYINRPEESSAAVLTILLGVPFYYLWVKRHPVKPGKNAP
ncbi:MAG: amino acid permease [bacterium]|nr:amino acid permease [bacterium]